MRHPVTPGQGIFSQGLIQFCSNKCFKKVEEVFETSNADYIRQDCIESRNDSFEMLIDEGEGGNKHGSN